MLELVPLSGPVFVDASGRRARRVRWISWMVGAACSVYTVGLVLSLTGATPIAPRTLLPLPGVPSTAPEENEAEAGADDKPAGPAATPGGTTPYVATNPNAPASPAQTGTTSPSASPGTTATPVGGSGTVSPTAKPSAKPSATGTGSPVASTITSPPAAPSQSAPPTDPASPDPALPSTTTTPEPQLPQSGGQ